MLFKMQAYTGPTYGWGFYRSGYGQSRFARERSLAISYSVAL